MVVTRQKKFKDILKNFENVEKIFIVGCGECAEIARTGGETEVKKMKDDLEKSGKKITGFSIPEAPCFDTQVRRLVRQHKTEISSSEAILVLACGLGVQNLKQNTNDKFIIPGCDTLFIGAVSKDGKNFSQYCSACGECILDITDGYCPLTRCPKGMLNGPCGGVYNGKCEVDREKDCVWTLIYENLKSKRKVKELKKIQLPKDYSKNVNPQFRSLKEG